MSKCLIPGCLNETTRIPSICTKHFIEGYGRLEDMVIPEIEKAESEVKKIIPETKKIVRKVKKIRGRK